MSRKIKNAAGLNREIICKARPVSLPSARKNYFSHRLNFWGKNKAFSNFGHKLLTIQLKKMNKYIVLIIAIYFTFCCSNCTNRNEEKEELITIDIEKAINSKPKGISLNEFIDTIIYIPLETSSDIIIDKIESIKFYNDNFFVNDYLGLYKFDSTGKLICKIGSKGRGPDEYTVIGNFFFQSDTIFIRSGSRTLAFDVTNCDFLNSFQLDNRNNSIYTETTGSNFAVFNYLNNMLEFYNRKGLLIDSVFYSRDKRPILDLAIGYSYYNIFFGTENSLKITTFCNDTIFEIDENFDLNPKYVVNLGNYKIPEKVRPDMVPWEIFVRESTSYLRKVPVETKNYIFIQLGFWGEIFNVTMPSYPDMKSGLIGLAVYDKRKNRVSLISRDDEKLPCFYPNFTDGDNSLISFIDPIEAISFYNENRYKYQFEKSFVEVIQKIKIDDNPVVMIVKLKE
jgi:hypothetical protein